MRVLIACEESGIVRRAFRELGHEAWSCDIIPAADESIYHIQDDVRCVLNSGWDLMIAHPPCTHLAVSGARWFKHKKREQEESLLFVWSLMTCSIPHIAIENPISVISSRIRKPDQIIQPWMFGHRETKATCLWLKNLPKLKPTLIVGPPKHHERKEFSKVHLMAPGPDRAKMRSRTYPGIAAAMAHDWGNIITTKTGVNK